MSHVPRQPEQGIMKETETMTETRVQPALSRNVPILGATSLLTDISSEMIYPLLPLYLTTVLRSGPAIVGIIEGIAESFASLVKVLSGFVSDRLKRRKALAILGYASSPAGKLLLYLSTSWRWVLAGRVVDRFGKGIRTAPRDALIADSARSDRKGRAYGLHRAMDTLGAALGVVIAYFFFTANQQNYKAVFLYSLLPAALGVVVLFFVREPGRQEHGLETNPGRAAGDLNGERTPPRPAAPLWSGLDRRLKAFLMIVLLFALANSSNQFLLLRAKSLGFSPATVLLLYLAYNITYGLLSYPAGRLSDRVGRKALLVTGYGFYGAVYLGFAIVRAPAYLWLLFPLYGVYTATTEGVEKALVADLAPGHLRATFIGLHATLTGVGLLPASILAGFLWKFLGARAPFYFGGGLGLIAALALRALI